MQQILLRFFPLRGVTLYWLIVSHYNQSTGTHLVAWLWLMGAAQFRAHGVPSAHLASSLIYLMGLPKSNRESQSEQAKHLD